MTIDDTIEHCGNDCGGTYEDGELIDDPMDCVCCECCCQCLGCVYAPRDGVPMTDGQRAPIAAMKLGETR
jgi:hypothetical protein